MTPFSAIFQRDMRLALRVGGGALMGRHVTYIDMAGWEREPWWIAHEYPERPVDRHTVWSWDCDACMMHLVASANVAGDLYAGHFRRRKP